MQVGGSFLIGGKYRHDGRTGTYDGAEGDIPLADAVRMASETPARLMGVSDRTGTLQRGKDADIVILDRKLNVRAVWSMGNLVPETNTLV